MRTYTGPTLDRTGTCTVTCPEWCVVDHDYWEDKADDMFHVSEEVVIVPPADPAASAESAIVPQMRADLMMHSTGREKDDVSILLRLDEYGLRAVDLDVAAADDVLAQLEEYTAGFRRLRDLLAEVSAGR